MLSARVDLEANDGPRLTLILPLGLDLHAGVTLYPGMAPEPLAFVTPRVCQATECYAFLPLEPELLDALDDMPFMRLRTTPFSAQPRDVPVSVHGFSAALERLGALRD